MTKRILTIGPAIPGSSDPKAKQDTFNVTWPGDDKLDKGFTVPITVPRVGGEVASRGAVAQEAARRFQDFVDALTYGGWAPRDGFADAAE